MGMAIKFDGKRIGGIRRMSESERNTIAAMINWCANQNHVTPICVKMQIEKHWSAKIDEMRSEVFEEVVLWLAHASVMMGKIVRPQRDEALRAASTKR